MGKCEKCGMHTTKLYRCPTCGTMYCSECKQDINTLKLNCKLCEKK